MLAKQLPHGSAVKRRLPETATAQRSSRYWWISLAQNCGKSVKIPGKGTKSSTNRFPRLECNHTDQNSTDQLASLSAGHLAQFAPL
mmetsp:Transcript_27835/g.36515  ORF Transcript_27835/g.36515 Transcript_27835/m.36515 type:complete len:86 (+) Transcript_27835:1592-1849(+)